MKTPSAAVARLMAEAAELRAAGASWDAVANAVRRKIDVCRRWPGQFPKIWSRLLAESIHQQRENAAGEAVTTLRQLLRSVDDKLRRDAAKALLAIAPEVVTEKTNDLDAYVEQLNDEGCQQLDASIEAVNE